MVRWALRVMLGCLFLAVFLRFQPSAWGAEGYMTYYTAESCQKEGTSGVFTASGELFDEEALTCALRSRGFGDEYVIYSPDTGRQVIVRHNDYGPGKGPASRGVIIDTTPAVWQALGLNVHMGKVEVCIQRVEG